MSCCQDYAFYAVFCRWPPFPSGRLDWKFLRTSVFFKCVPETPLNFESVTGYEQCTVGVDVLDAVLQFQTDNMYRAGLIVAGCVSVDRTLCV